MLYGVHGQHQLGRERPFAGGHHCHRHNGSSISTSKFLVNSGHQYESKATYKTSYFGCLSNSSKKSGSGGNHGHGSSFGIGGRHLHSGNSSGPFHNHHYLHSKSMLDISPILHKSVSCFDPIIKYEDVPVGNASALFNGGSIAALLPPNSQ